MGLVGLGSEGRARSVVKGAECVVRKVWAAGTVFQSMRRVTCSGPSKW